MRIQRLLRSLPFLVGRGIACRFTACLVLLALLVTLLPTLSDAQPTCPPDGDVDQNGSVTAADALLVFQQALGLAQLSACQQSIADVFPQPANPDGSITASDALCIFQKALSLPSCLDTLPSSNQPPVVDAGPDQSVDEGVMVFLSGTGSDPDGTVASYTWTQTGGTTVSLTGSDAATAVFVAPEVSVDETLTFRLTVSDDAGAQASDEVWVTVRPAMQPAEQASAAEVFQQAISGPIVQTKCVTCHVQDGASGNTRLVFVHATDSPDHEALNLRAFEDLLAKVADEGGGSYVLNKIQGVGHGGGVQVSPGTEEFTNMQRFLGLLGEDVALPAPVTVETLFDTVIMASPRKTLRRAALIFAGRIPTDEEYEAVEGGDEAVLRTTIRGLMEGPQFHEFLIRASNDRLLTDRGAGDLLNNPSLVELWNQNYRLIEEVYAGRADERELWLWEASVDHGVRQAPLELIAYVVENDLPYTEVLTADYVMANPWAAAGYGAPTFFDAPQDVNQFQPSRIEKYYRKGEGFRTEQHPDIIELFRVVDPGPLFTDYPHAGILNTISFLNRYPTTATNRNRARARWTYYHFLGVDVEKSASRTTDPVALADTNNPTMHNPNCTVCHQRLDPVAGAFQNYSEEGHYKHSWGGVDSLDEFYKYEPPGRQDLPVYQRSPEEGTMVLGTVRLFADSDNELGLKNLRTFEGNRKLHLGLGEVVIRTLNGDVVERYQTRDVAADEACGAPTAEGYVLWDCTEMLVLPLVVPRGGDYIVEIQAWVQEAGEKAATLQVWMPGPFYQEGDTWYHDMRTPGFAGEWAPDSDNSLQWLADQIVADKRFAEATVKFWWPAIMGSEVTEFPEDANDADFAGLLLAANAQGAEVERLASRFRDGFHGGLPYNLKDLLVETVLSKWFRADGVTDTNPVRRVALRDAGARRLLTPEELARKTAAVSGVQWGRRSADSLPPFHRWPSRLTTDYRLLYGGIDSHSVTERARDLTAVMAGVPKRHAAEVSCPVVMREMYLLPDEKRRLFAGIDRYASPGLEISSSFEIEANSRRETETLSLNGTLTAGSKTVRVTFTNRYWDEENRRGQNVYLDRLDVRNAAGQIVATREFENVRPHGHCGDPNLGSGYFVLDCTGSAAVQVDILTAGSYTIEVLAWADQVGDGLPILRIAVETDTESPGVVADPIRRKLVELYDKLLGVQVAPDSPDVEAMYRLFINVMERKREADQDYFPYWSCDWSDDVFFFEGILDDALVQRQNESGDRWHEFDWDRVGDFLDGTDFSDPHHTAQAWMVVLAAMMMDYRYLYL